MKKSEPWYIHAALYLVIAILAYILIRVAIVDPTDFMEKDKYYKTESHLRMSNIRQAQIMYEKKNGRYTDDLSALINFVKTDSAVLAAINGVDSLTERSTNPFEKLTVGSFVPESLMYSPKSHTPFILKIDRTTKIDTVINMKGKVIRVDTVKTIGSIYQLESPDGYGQIGDLESPTKKIQLVGNKYWMPILTNQVGINIAKHAMQLVEISQKENKIYLENVDEEFFDEALEANLKETKFIHILQNAYNEIVLRNPLKTTNVLLSLPLSFFKTFEVPVDKNLTKNDLNDYTLWEFSKLFPVENKSEFYFQKIFLETPDYLSYKRELVFAINKDLLKRFYKFCVRNNLQLKAADISHIASNSILFYNNKKSNGISVLIEDTKISAMVFNQTNLVFSKTKNLNAISEVPIFIKDILLEIEKRNLKREKIEKLFLFGSKISNELLINIENSLNISSTIIEPFNELKLDIAHLNERLSIGNLTKYSSALGMALRLVS